MKLVIRDATGALVAEAEADLQASADFAHVTATFTPGPGFRHVEHILEDFECVYATGDLERAEVIHAQVDELGLIASGEGGERYAVSNVYCRHGALLFAVSRVGGASA